MPRNWLNIIVVAFIFCGFFFLDKVRAEDTISFGIASNLPILDSEVADGTVVATSARGFFLTDKEYDTGIVGVTSLNPAVSINIEDSSLSATSFDDSLQKYPVISSGNAQVLVSSVNGSIRKGDLITSSKVKGIGMKADKSGYVLGSALEDYDSSDTSATQKISVALNIHYYASKASTTSSKLSDIFKLSAIATIDEPLTVFKYVLSALIVVLSFLFGFYSFGRLARTGVEALGRNPMAAKLIQVGIVINTVITVAIIAAGLLIGLFILRL